MHLAVCSDVHARFLVALVASSAIAHADPAPVVGGTTVPAGKWPDAVAVIGAQGSCTGTLIAPTVVLTAGHCAEVNPSQIIANTTDYAVQGGVHVNVRSVTSYPAWQSTYDLAVIVLDKPVTGITPRAVGIDCTFDAFAAGAQVHLVGFGLIDETGTGNNTALHEAMAPVTNPTCTTGRGCQDSVAPGGEFVAGGSGTDSCFGDSGGPVYLDTPRGPVVIAAVSRGVNGSATACGGGGIYVRTDKLVPWLETTAGVAITKDRCAAQPVGGGSDGSGAGTDPSSDVDGDTVTAGCAASNSQSLAPLALVLLLARRRRR